MKDDPEHKHFVFDESATSLIQALLSCPGEPSPATTASVKFMITLQDERDLLNLGYTQEQITKLTPREAMDIIQAGTKELSRSIK